ncbi:MAG: hypothetical protein INR71_04735 [Terriglobus roseus]|nr:hypothetical protein [Terriglobus roseus]
MQDWNWDVDAEDECYCGRRKKKEEAEKTTASSGKKRANDNKVRSLFLCSKHLFCPRDCPFLADEGEDDDDKTRRSVDGPTGADPGRSVSSKKTQLPTRRSGTRTRARNGTLYTQRGGAVGTACVIPQARLNLSDEAAKLGRASCP